jgi:hypothetical protein
MLCYNFGMRPNQFTRRVAAWIACLAMLFAALAPSISHAMRADAWTEVCSASSVKMVKVAAGQGDPDDARHLEHCAFCATHAAAPALLPGNAGGMPLLLGRDSYPPLFFQSPSPLAAWTHAQPRAPPV